MFEVMTFGIQKQGVMTFRIQMFGVMKIGIPKLEEW